MQTVGLEGAGAPRRVDEVGVRALDEAVARTAGLDQVLHNLDPRRLNRFADGGPPVWSIGLCPCADGGYLFVTYGLSRHIDPDAQLTHELSLRVPATADGQPPEWPRQLLTRLARRQLKRGPLELHALVALGRPITGGSPETAMRGFTLAAESTISDVRRVVGLHADELTQGELWSGAGLLTEVARRLPRLDTDITRASLTADPGFVSAMEAGAQRHGSATECINLVGFGWRHRARGFAIDVPGGPALRRVARLLRSRLEHGRALIIQDGGRQVRFYPHHQTAADVTIDGRLEVGCDRLDLLLFVLEASACEPDPSPVVLCFNA